MTAQRKPLTPAKTLSRRERGKKGPVYLSALLRNRWPLVSPWPSLLEGRRGPQDGRLVATPADDVQANRQAVGGEAAGNAGGGVTDHVDREGKGQVAPEGVHGTSSGAEGIKAGLFDGPVQVNGPLSASAFR